MRLREFTTETNDNGSQIVRASARITDDDNQDEPEEWIEFRLKIDDMETARTGTLTRLAVLEKARDIIHEQAQIFRRLGVGPSNP